MSAENLDEAVKIGTSHLNGEPMDVFMEPVELPADPDEREVCEQHLKEGRGEELMDNFWMAGCHFPEKDAVSTNIYVGLSCQGSRFRKRCRLALTQHNPEGEELTRGTFTGNSFK